MSEALAVIPARVWIVEAEHWHIPGRPRSVHASSAGADAKAAEHVALLEKDAPTYGNAEGFTPPAEPVTAANWRARLLAVQRAVYEAEVADVPEDERDEFDAEDSEGDVWATPHDVEPDPSPAYAYTPETCPTKHYNGGDDVCEDCGEELA